MLFYFKCCFTSIYSKGRSTKTKNDTNEDIFFAGKIFVSLYPSLELENSFTKFHFVRKIQNSHSINM